MGMNLAARHERQAIVLGALLRLLLLAAALPVTHVEWFLPFLSHVAAAPSLDPWTGFLGQGGAAAAFPYGPLYILAFLPLTALGGLVSPAGAALGLGLTVLLLDTLLFVVLKRLVAAARRPLVTYAYWMSPLVVYICYWHGQLDVFPVLILATALLFLREGRFSAAGFGLGLAAAAKMSMALAIPFVWIHVIAARRLRDRAPRLIAATCLGLASLLPFALSPGFRRMVLETPEREKVFALAIGYGDLIVYVMPLVLAALVIFAWRIRRFNFDILFSLIGVGFFILFLLTPASPGWALWLMPFVVVYLSRGGSLDWLAATAFSFLFVLFHVLTSSGALLPFAPPRIDLPPRALNLLLSVYLASGGLIAFQMLNRGLLRNPFYRATRAPLALGIAGDSGAGKDTLATALEGLFGQASTAHVSGDDYHSWDRHKPMWRALTHLNPSANNLRRFSEDVLALKAGHGIEVSHYDHRSGRMTKPIRVQPTDVIIASGLHALHMAELNRALDLGIFLAMDEELRIALKLRRDVRSRGHAPDAVLDSLKKREPDSARYIRPQILAADLVLALEPLARRDLADPLHDAAPPRMALRIEAPAPSDIDPLCRVLIGLCGMEAIPLPPAGDRNVVRAIGDPSAADIAAACRALMPGMADYIAMQPRWAGGLVGVMQLAVLDQLGQRLARRKGQ